MKKRITKQELFAAAYREIRAGLWDARKAGVNCASVPRYLRID